MERAIDSDPELAIGTAKELIETCCSTVLLEQGIEPDNAWSLARLVKEAAKSLQLAPQNVAPNTPGADKLRLVLGGSELSLVVSPSYAMLMERAMARPLGERALALATPAGRRRCLDRRGLPFRLVRGTTEGTSWVTQ